MDELRPPWFSRPTDINSEVRYLEHGSLDPYWAMFNFLRLSPSYEMARKEADEGFFVSDEPANFGRVRETYELLGDVRFTFFTRWWRERGFTAFGRKSGTVSIPVRLGSKEDMLAQAAAFLKDYDAGGPLMTLRRTPKKEVTARQLLLLWTKANRPDLPLWQLGAAVELSEEYTKELNSPNPSEYDRRAMGKMASRELEKCESIAENAARGVFPADDPVHKNCFDWPEVKARMDLFNKWERDERIRYKAAPDSFV
jgi:hypothetical protein